MLLVKALDDTSTVSETRGIIVGGLAGLATAAGLATRGLASTLFESRPRLGGRAGSFHEASQNEWIDHCQHVSLGCCTNLNWLLQQVGLNDRLRQDRTLHFVSPPSAGSPTQISHLRAGPWPAPFHLLPALGRLVFLDRRQRRELRRGLVALARTKDCGEEPIADWLRRHGQSQPTIDHFWQVILVSALSETLDRIAVSHARHVFVTGFLGHRRGWELQVPTVPLEKLYGIDLGGWLTNHGVEVHGSTGVRRVIFADDLAVGVELRDGTKVAAGQVVLAVPPHRLADLVSDDLLADPQLAGVNQIDTAPIAAVHFWLDRPFTTLPHAVLVGRLSQWMFRRPSAENGTDYVQVVISAARHVVQRDREDVISEVLDELRTVWPEAESVTVHRARLVIEHRAVFSPTPGIDHLRPAQQSPVRNLQLAGDWTQTGWPGTMEGAVRSGLLAAENVLAHLGQPGSLLRPDLPSSWLARRIFRL